MEITSQKIPPGFCNMAIYTTKQPAPTAPETDTGKRSQVVFHKYVYSWPWGLGKEEAVQAASGYSFLMFIFDIY